ncbi:hypothetical protein H7F33_14745 [Pedobacter sp. PAMC26386]|nr:hypothetical protein H7F33_14745 [Pedobacter sp. PAMC26386]
MKKTAVIFIAFIAISTSCIAQTEKGKIFLGGSFEISSKKSGIITKNSTSFGVNPNIGFFVANNLVIGTGIGFVHSNLQPIISPNPNVSWSMGSKSDVINVRPFARYYVTLTPAIKFFSEAGVLMNWRKSRSIDRDGTVSPEKLSSNFYSAALSPGFAVFPSKKIGIELMFTGFQFLKQNDEYQKDVKSHFKSFNIGADFFNPRLGLQFYL